MKYKKKRIGINDLQVGMELATHVMTSNGLILIPSGTIINEDHIFKLNLYQIFIVDIKEYLDTDTPVESNPPKDSSNKSSLNFTEFKQTYDNKKELVNNQLNNIGDGGSINISELFTLSNDLIKILNSKSELFNYLNKLRSNDEYTYSHSLNVSMLCNIFGQWLHLDSGAIETLTVAGLLHDIGKLSIDNNIINKPGKLTTEEFDIIKKHPKIGYNIVKDYNIPHEIKMGILMHHEKIDGTGYPLGLKDEEIHDFAKIIAIADIYDAMTSVRSYHDKTSPFKVIRLFERESYGLLDTKFLFVFLQNIAYNYLHRNVRLSNGEEGKIIFIHPKCPSKPIIDVGSAIIDMQDESNLFIEEII